MLQRLLKRKKDKVVVLGLDGVPHTLLRRFADEGIMPNVAKLIEEGTLCTMTASVPEVSSTSWSTFMTGVNPGRHGIYGFMELQKDNYSWRFPNFNDLKSKTIWEIAGDNGKRSIILNVPSTYPAKPLRGMMVSGFVALDLKKASYPDALYQYLQSIDYKLDVDAGKAAKSLKEFTDDIIYTFYKRVDAINHLYDSEECNLFIAAITETDRLHHYLWSALDQTDHPQHDFFLDFYRKLDVFIGSFYRRIKPGTPFIMLSDHGFTTIKREVNLNVFLKEKGYLRFMTPDPQSFQDIEKNSQAFVLDPSRVYIHTKNKFSRGCVTDERYDDITKSIRNDLLSLRINGDDVVKHVYRKKDIYEGPSYYDAPDLVVLSNEGYDLKGSLKNKDLFGSGPLTGGHTRENALFYINQPLKCGIPNIVDVGVTALKLLGIDSDHFDGKSLV